MRLMAPPVHEAEGLLWLSLGFLLSSISSLSSSHLPASLLSFFRSTFTCIFKNSFLDHQNGAQLYRSSQSHPNLFSLLSYLPGNDRCILYDGCIMCDGRLTDNTNYLKFFESPLLYDLISMCSFHLRPFQICLCLVSIRIAYLIHMSFVIGWLTHLQHASVSQGRTCSDNGRCCHT